MNEGQGTAEQTPGKRRRKWPCLLCGFLCGFGITVLAVVVFAIAQPGPVVPEGTSWEKSVADALLALWIALIAGMIGMLVGVIIYDRKKIGELPCRCGLRFHGMSMTRCPVCKRPFIRKPVRIPPYLWGGFLWGFGIPAVPTVVGDSVGLGTTACHPKRRDRSSGRRGARSCRDADRLRHLQVASPLIETETANWSPAAPSEAMRSCSSAVSFEQTYVPALVRACGLTSRRRSSPWRARPECQS
jgi:hypothetical protein